MMTIYTAALSVYMVAVQLRHPVVVSLVGVCRAVRLCTLPAAQLFADLSAGRAQPASYRSFWFAFGIHMIYPAVRDYCTTRRGS